MQAVAPVLDAMVEEVRLGAFRLILASVGLVLGDVVALALLVVRRWRVCLGSAPAAVEWIWRRFVLRQLALSVPRAGLCLWGRGGGHDVGPAC